MKELLRTTVQDLWGFIRSPRLSFESPPPLRAIWQVLGIILVLDILLNMFAVMPMAALEKAGLISEQGHAFGMMKDWHWSLLLLAAAILAPIIEETIFRGWLSDSPAYMLFGAIVVIPTLCWFISLYGSGMVFMTIVWGFGALCFVACSVIAIRYFNNDEFQEIFSRWWADNLRIPYYLSSLAFGLIHFSNWEAGEVYNLTFAAILVLPQVVSGFVLGYVRLRFGLVWGMVLHGIFNAIFISIGLVNQ